VCIREPCLVIQFGSISRPGCAVFRLIHVNDFANNEKTDLPYLSCLVDTLLGLPSVRVSSRVRVSVQLGHVRQHGVQDTGIGGRSRLHIHVDWAGIVGSLNSRHLESQRLYCI
jgi:hypothetical protein